MKTLLRAALMGSVLSFASLGFAATGAFAQDAPGMPAGHPMMAPHGAMLSLSAYGETKVAPDMASISTGVVTEAPTAQEAMRLNRERMNQVIAALKRQGIAEKDIQTSGLNLSAQYNYENNKPPELRGYQASNQVTVIIYDLNRVGQAADAVVAAGSNQINGISFGLRDPQAAEDAARLEAVRRLQAKANLYSRALGKPIVALRSFSEGGGYQPSPPMPMMRMEMAAAPPPPDSTSVAPGQLTLRIDVQGIYELAQ